MDRLKRALSSSPDLTWLGDDAQIELPQTRRDRPSQTKETSRRPRPRRWEVNAPLLLGGLIVSALFLVVLFGPLWAPENPYLAGQRISMVIDGQYTVPPLPPMPGLPLGSDQWGRDILSLLLYGTRNTLVACLFIAMARILLGSALGMLAAWNEGGLVDRLVMSLVEWTTALPALLSGMILILALGIERGITIFIIALCFVGWAEIAQYVRSEFMVVRRKPFIEGARVVGLDALGIAIRHILPNLLPALVVIAVLEMGAVLMILGELGFIGVFIGGGTWVQVGDTAVANIPDIPEWGAMMAGARQYARSKTWMVFYPALAFFLAVLGFNLLGEGLRRMVQERGVSTAFVLSKRAVLFVIVITLATAYIITHVGPAPSYAGLAQRFDPEEAWAHLQVLTAEELDGRQAGTQRADAAADYIAARFAEYGLEPLRPTIGFRLPMSATVVSPIAAPRLELLDEEGRLLRSFAYRQDFGVDIRGHGGSGEATASLALLSFGRRAYQPQDFRGLDLRGQIVLCLAENAPADFQVEALLRGAVGILIINSDTSSHLQLADPAADYMLKPTLPVLHISPGVANALLADDGLTVDALGQKATALERTGQLWTVRELRSRVHVSVALSQVQTVRVDSVVGVLRGADATLNKQLVIVSAHYDGAGRQPDGTVWQGANDGPVGVAAMLEILRLWRARGFAPRRTMLFAAWAGGEWDYSGAHEYAKAELPYSILRGVAVVNLDGLGRGGEELIAQGDAKLLDLLLRSAEASGVPAREGAAVRHPYQSAFLMPALTVSWSHAQVPPNEDTLEAIDRRKLGQAGQAINLVLITLAREYDY